MFDCLNKVIGVTNIDCPCLLDGLSDGTKTKLKESESGFYMDAIPDGFDLKGLKTLDDCKNAGELALAARDQAIEDFTSDVIVAISNKYKKASRNYNGTIARAAYTKTMTDDGQFQGVRILGNERTDGTIKIKRIRVVGNMSGDVTFKIVRAPEGTLDWEEVHSSTLTLVANNFSPVDLGTLKEIPLGKDLIAYDYRFYYDRSSLPGMFPKDTPLGCNCNSSDEDLLSSYAEIRGISFSDEGDLSSFTEDETSHGIIIDVEVLCETEPLFCREYAGSEDIQIATRFGIAYRAQVNLIEKVQASPTVSRNTMQNREFWFGKRNKFQKKYEDFVIFIAGRVDTTVSDCFACRPRTMFKTKIRS